MTMNPTTPPTFPTRAYAEHKSWAERLLDARRRERAGAGPDERFTQDDVDDANHWLYCSVGERREKWPGLPLKEASNPGWPAPEDQGLYNRGMEFAAAVRNGRVDEAEVLYEEIRERVQALKARAEKAEQKLAEPEPPAGEKVED